MIKPSLCCISIELQKQNFKLSTMTRTQFRNIGVERGIREIVKRSLNNLTTINKTIEFCVNRNWNYRIGSNVIPLATLPEVEDYGLSRIFDDPNVSVQLNEISKRITDSGIRISMHPDHYVVIASANPTTVEQSIKELEYHSHFMDRIGLPRNHRAPINVHINSFKDGCDIVYERFRKVFTERLSAGVRNRLTLEGEDKINSWSINKLTKYFKELKIPITYDNLHHKCNSDGLCGYDAMMICIDSWPLEHKPLFHFSDSDGNNPRAHSDYAKELPNEYKSLGRLVDLDFEFKMKDLAISEFQKTVDNFVN